MASVLVVALDIAFFAYALDVATADDKGPTDVGHATPRPFKHRPQSAPDALPPPEVEALERQLRTTRIIVDEKIATAAPLLDEDGRLRDDYHHDDFADWRDATFARNPEMGTCVESMLIFEERRLTDALEYCAAVHKPQLVDLDERDGEDNATDSAIALETALALDE